MFFEPGKQPLVWVYSVDSTSSSTLGNASVDSKPNNFEVKLRKPRVHLSWRPPVSWEEVHVGGMLPAGINYVTSIMSCKTNWADEPNASTSSRHFGPRRSFMSIPFINPWAV